MPIDFKKIFLKNWLEKPLAFGVFFIMAGLPILQSVSHYHTFFYILILLPIILYSATYPKSINKNLSNITKIFIVFSIWSSLSILWSDSNASILDPIKRSIYILSLFIAFSIITNIKKENLLLIFIISGLTVTTVSIYSLYLFISNYSLELIASYPLNPRLIGAGALSNPLLSSHIFGFFAVLFLVLSTTASKAETKTKGIYLILGFILIVITIATGSRTSLVALITTSIWIAFTLKSKRSILIITATAIIVIVIYLLYPEAILNRGLSHRPELWSIAINKILSQPMIGYGFDSNSGFYIAAVDTTFREPHNIHLSILYFTGIIGFSLWCIMHAYALWVCWKNKADTLFIVASALLVYGIAAGMTEGGGLLPRPKEHWFITWIPLAFVSALLTHKNLKTKESVAERT
ncbi:MAG TPA: O-antigen ligase family protein [Thiopseudomonas sp.]|nr:O-antigen ligase family protein [Thiopseudomonas sp.]